MKNPFQRPQQTRFQYNVNGTNVFLSREQATALVERGLSVMRTDGRNTIMFTDEAMLRGQEALMTVILSTMVRQ